MLRPVSPLTRNGGAWVGYLTTPRTPPGPRSLPRRSRRPGRGCLDRSASRNGIALGPDGMLYAAEMSTEMRGDGLFFTADTGRIVRQTGPASAEESPPASTFRWRSV